MGFCVDVKVTFKRGPLNHSMQCTKKTKKTNVKQNSKTGSLPSHL